MDEAEELLARIDLLNEEIGQEIARKRRMQQEHARDMEVLRTKLECAEASAAALRWAIRTLNDPSAEQSQRDDAWDIIRADDAGSKLAAALEAWCGWYAAVNQHERAAAVERALYAAWRGDDAGR